MHVRARLLVALVALLVPSLSSAQQTAPSHTASPAVSAAQMVGPTVDGTATAFKRLSLTADSASLAMAQPSSPGKPVALMIVGGVAILLGAVIGDAPGTLFMIGGAVTLLYGLYLYLQ